MPNNRVNTPKKKENSGERAVQEILVDGTIVLMTNRQEAAWRKSMAKRIRDSKQGMPQASIAWNAPGTHELRVANVERGK